MIHHFLRIIFVPMIVLAAFSRAFDHEKLMFMIIIPPNRAMLVPFEVEPWFVL